MRRTLIACFLLVTAALPAQAQETSNNCTAGNAVGRTCLEYRASEYLKALWVHQPSQPFFADNVKFTEDGVEKKLGDGLWKTVSKIRNGTQAFVDVRQGMTATFAVVEEDGVPALLVVRLKISDSKITEVETMITRGQKEGMIFDVDSIRPAMPGMAMTGVPAKSKLQSREDAIRIAEYYPHGLQAGSFVTDDAPFAPEAYRFENGRLMAGPGCTFSAGCDNIKTQRIPKLSSLTYKVALVDEDLGVVLLRQDFGAGSVSPGNSLIVWEAFKVYGGQIHAVEAFMKVMPIGSKPGWD